MRRKKLFELKIFLMGISLEKEFELEGFFK